MKVKLGALLLLIFLTGCATGPNTNPRDPFEPFNRSVYKFNDTVDTAVLKPVATAYRDIVPKLVRQGVNNFFSNLQDAWSVVNNILQLKGDAAGDSLARFGVNTFLGLGGIFDLATDLQIESHTKDFGHTLGYWGVPAGPYIMLPLLGPSTLRDTVALPVDTQGDIVAGLSDVPARNTLTVVRVVDKRTELFKAEKMLDEIALDKYTFIRDAYLQRRRSSIYDGNPPEDADTAEVQPAPNDLVTSIIETPVNNTPAEALSNAGIPGDEKVKP